jgi:His/Glu/Gln/Arg/opine family amino acid ABC transporter permease subunit
MILQPDFFAAVLSGMLLNFEIAAEALLAGLVLAIPLTLGTVTKRTAIRRLTASVVLILRAAPTFVVMFFLFNLLPHRVSIGGIAMTMSPQIIVALSLLPYSSTYFSENGAEALRQWRAGSVLAASLFVPNTGRAYLVLVMSTGSGAAIGVTEGISIILHHAESLPTLSERLAVFATGILLFAIPLQTGFMLLTKLRGMLTRIALSAAHTPQSVQSPDHA